MQCPRCQHENREGLKFCNQCGMPLSGQCAECRFTNESGSKFCGECGASLTAHGVVPNSAQSIQSETDSEREFQATLPGVIWLLQRKMFGRAKLDLLSQRFLQSW